VIASVCTLFFLVWKSSHSATISWESRNEAPRWNSVQPDALEIVIAPRKDSTREKLAINVTVINISEKPIGWDSEFSFFLGWNLGGLAQKESPTPIEQTKESLSRERFVTIAPGDRLSRDVVLTKPFRAFGYEGGGDGDFDHPAEPIRDYEVMASFELPKRYRQFSIGLEYDGSSPGAFGAFKDLFGFAPDEVNIWRGSCTSNVLDIKIHD